MRPWRIAVCAASALALARPARAQCISNASSCTQCHEVQGLRPVLAGAQPWHVDHRYGDLCAACHAGDPAAPEKAVAHLGLRHPLADTRVACAGCHPADHAERAERYRAWLRAAAPPPPAPPTGAAPPPGRGVIANRILAGVAALLGVALIVVVRGRAPRRAVLGWLRAKTWTPYGAGILLGLVVACSEVIFGRPLAAAGAFDKLAAYPGSWLFPDSPYYAHLMTPGITWQVWMILGALGGSFASSRLSGEARLRWLPDTQWRPRFGASRRVRLALAFGGAMLVQIGAGIAGGCTSGLAISGGAVLSPAAYLFMVGMFAGGIPTAWLWYRGRAA